MVIPMLEQWRIPCYIRLQEVVFQLNIKNKFEFFIGLCICVGVCNAG